MTGTRGFADGVATVASPRSFPHTSPDRRTPPPSLSPLQHLRSLSANSPYQPAFPWPTPTNPESMHFLSAVSSSAALPWRKSIEYGFPIPLLPRFHVSNEAYTLPLVNSVDRHLQQGRPNGRQMRPRPDLGRDAPNMRWAREPQISVRCADAERRQGPGSEVGRGHVQAVAQW